MIDPPYEEKNKLLFLIKQNKLNEEGMLFKVSHDDQRARNWFGLKMKEISKYLCSNVQNIF